MTEGWTVREAHLDDLPSVAHLWTRLCVEDMGVEPGDEARQQWLASFRSHLGRFSFAFVVANDTAVGGFLLARLIPDPAWLGGQLAAEISSIYLDAEIRGTPSGEFARRLLDRAIGTLMAAGAKSIRVNIRMQNQRSARFFENAGFVLHDRTFHLRDADASAGGPTS